LLLGLLATRSVFAGPDLNQYDLVFGDEFDGTELDANKWVTGFLWGPYHRFNNEEQFYVDTLGMHRDFTHSPFQFTGSSLKIVATPVSDQLQIWNIAIAVRKTMIVNIRQRVSTICQAQLIATTDFDLLMDTQKPE